MTDQPTTTPSTVEADTARKADYEKWLATQQPAADAATSEDGKPEEPVDPPLYPDVMNGRPRFLVVESNLHVQTSREGELVLPLDIPTKVFRSIGADQEELDQLFTILDALGDNSASEKLASLGILETMGIVVRFFEEFERKAQALMGEASRSSK